MCEPSTFQTCPLARTNEVDRGRGVGVALTRGDVTVLVRANAEGVVAPGEVVLLFFMSN